MFVSVCGWVWVRQSKRGSKWKNDRERKSEANFEVVALAAHHTDYVETLEMPSGSMKFRGGEAVVKGKSLSTGSDPNWHLMALRDPRHPGFPHWIFLFFHVMFMPCSHSPSLLFLHLSHDISQGRGHALKSAFHTAFLRFYCTTVAGKTPCGFSKQ